MQQAATASPQAAAAADIAGHLAAAVRGMRNGHATGTLAVSEDDIDGIEEILQEMLYETGDIALDDLPEAVRLIMDGMTVAQALDKFR